MGRSGKQRMAGGRSETVSAIWSGFRTFFVRKPATRVKMLVCIRVGVIVMRVGVIVMRVGVIVMPWDTLHPWKIRQNVV